jgi:hypothetical protein
MRYALTLLLLLAVVPLQAQSKTRRFDFSGDPAGAKPDGWSSVGDPLVTFEATGPSQLQLGDFGGEFTHALGAVGRGYLVVRFGEPALHFGGLLGTQRSGSRVTFQTFLDGGYVGGYSSFFPSHLATIGVGTEIGPEGSERYFPFDELHIALAVGGEDVHEVVTDLHWMAASDYPHLVATPEPASMALLGTGLAGLAGAARKRRRKQDARG